MSKLRNIKELAKIAGVSTGTVSRALTDSGLIAAETRARIKAIARAHDFRPNVLARNLRIQKTGAIGVAIPLAHEPGQAISDPFFIKILGHLADALNCRGYDLLLTRIVPTSRDWLDQLVDSGRTDGLILIGQSNQFDAYERVAERYQPLVVWGGHAPDQRHCSVGSDNRLGGELAATHLIEQGCERITFIGDERAFEIAQRLAGCRDAMARAGLSEQLSILPAHLIAEAAHPEIAAYLATGARPQGIVAASDVIAMSALRALAELGLDVPSQVRVIGFDDLPFAQQTVPPLTTIRQDIERGAIEIVDRLLRRIEGDTVPALVMRPELIVRKTA